MAAEEWVARHYGDAGIAERILAALRSAHGAAAAITVDALAPLDHFHGRGQVATQELAALLAPQPGERVLDIGSGIGGPARWMAAKCGCRVTGVDLTPEFCAAAVALNDAAGLADRVEILNGSALDLPVPDSAFDRAYSQNVIMNIADKPRFYREAFRALRPGGLLALSNLCTTGKGELHYPVPWAETPATSFLATVEEMRADLLAAGFEIVSFEDTTAQTLPATVRNRERVERDGLPALGTHLIMGERLREMQINSARNVEEGLVATVEALVRKPAG
ncbi:MAG TPA: methyltransferase domain-containing protein [Stellaceae bacterium]|nr:methyltransferase domain-containing protein [Stellaceae bacterium]